LLAHVNQASARLAERLQQLVKAYPEMLRPGTVFGCIASIGVADPALAKAIYRAVYDEGVLCHSVSVIEPTVLKFLPPLIIDDAVIEEIASAVDRALQRIRSSLSEG
jgi:acetylornithine/succinyldiaminopimelate/putrescine aminotransferase